MRHIRWIALVVMPAALASERDPSCESTASGACWSQVGTAEAEAEAVEQEEAAAQDMRLLQARAPQVGRRSEEAVQPIWHYAKNCLQPTPGMAVCNVPGMCEHFCGPGNACCRKYSTTDPAECQGVTFFPVAGYYTCVRAAQAPTTEVPSVPSEPSTDVITTTDSEEQTTTTTTTITTTTTTTLMVCGDEVSEDCNLDYDGSINSTADAAQFCDRCINEVGDFPLRSRCKTCCDICNPILNDLPL